MKKSIKRILSLLMSCAMAASMLGTVAFAEESESYEPTNTYVLNYTSRDIKGYEDYDAQRLYASDHYGGLYVDENGDGTFDGFWYTDENGYLDWNSENWNWTNFSVLNMINTGKLKEGGEGAYASIPAYCVDAVTSSVKGYEYRRVNLEDSTYFSDEVAGRIRAIFMNSFPFVTDMDAIAREIGKKHPGLVVRVCHMNPIAADTSKPPLVSVYQSMLSTIPVTEKEKENAVNILGKFVPIPEECEMHEFFAFHGIPKVRQIAEYDRFADFCEMGNSKYNLVISPSAKYTAEYIDKKYGTISAFNVISYDLGEIRKNYEEIEESLFSEGGEKFDFTGIEEKAKEAVEHALKKVKNIPISVSDSAVMRPFSLAKALLSYGFAVKEVVAQTAVSVDKEAYEELLETYPDIKIIQPLHHRSAVREKAGEGMVAIGFEGAYLRQCDYVVDLSDDEGMYGYYGVIRLMNMLEQSVEEKADLRKMIEEYGAVV